MRGISKAYLLKRFSMLLLTVWLGITIMFIIPRLAPGDPIASMMARMSAQAGQVEQSAELISAWQERFGLNDPLLVQYGRYMLNSVRFNLGYSMSYFPTEVEELIARAIPWTIGLLTIATLISFILGIAIGALLGWRSTPHLVRLLLPLSLSFTSIPAFMLGILLIYFFAFGWPVFPFGGAYTRGIDPEFNLAFIGSVLHHGVLPAFAIVLTSMGYWALGMRAMMITNAGEDYMILARAKGLSASRIFWMYGVRNAILPQITALALSIGSIAGGSIIVEYIFTYPGMGYLLYQGIINNDYPLIQGIVFVLIVSVSVAVFIIDLIYPLVDPRINYERR
jgi:peptide/nickel transport system permease protein